MAHERRHFVRVTFKAPGQLTTSEASHTIEVEDLSLKGVLARLPASVALAVGTPCQLILPLLRTDQHIVMALQVAHVDGLHVGFRCISIDLDSVTHLRRLIELQLGNASLLERDLTELLQ